MSVFPLYVIETVVQASHVNRACYNVEKCAERDI